MSYLLLLYRIYSLLNYGLLDIEPLPKHSEKVFAHLLLSGECKRGVIPEVIGMKGRTASRLIAELLKRDFIESDSKAGAIRLKIGASMASFLFPMLVPERELLEKVFQRHIQRGTILNKL